MINIDNLPHISALQDIECNFKVYAGPGAGKTTWLISHLERTLKESTRLNITSKIACITYTNVAADEILNRLKCDRNRFDISTIHSFLYRNIVKPFSYLIAKDEKEEILFEITKLNGHDEHIVHGDRLKRWINSIGKLNRKDYNFYLASQNRQKVVQELSSLDYIFKGNEIDLVIRQKRGAKIPKAKKELWIYKSKYWKDGILHHEDVLYFSYLILKKLPRVIEFIRNKFPYIFVDEFQDTTEIQTWILDKISNDQTIVGVVGDLAQSIYKFTGAKRSDFIDFKSSEIKEYKLDRNHRSSRNIVEFLNRLRPDINQKYGKDKPEGSQVQVLIGSIQAAEKWCKTQYQNADIFVLTRKNISVSEMKNQTGVIKKDLLEEMYSNDLNSSRANLIHATLMAYKFHQKNEFKSSLKELLRHLKRASSSEILKLTLREIAIYIIELLKDPNKRKKSILQFYTEVEKKVLNDYGLKIGSSLTRGRAKEFYEKYTVNDLLPSIKVDTKSEDKIRTIHSAKGIEFVTVLVHFDKTEDFRKYIFESLKYIDFSEDDCRIYYVACSRAMENLIINIPNGIKADFDLLTKLKMKHEILRS